MQAFDTNETIKDWISNDGNTQNHSCICILYLCNSQCFIYALGHSVQHSLHVLQCELKIGRRLKIGHYIDLLLTNRCTSAPDTVIMSRSYGFHIPIWIGFTINWTQSARKKKRHTQTHTHVMCIDRVKVSDIESECAIEHA